MSDITPKKKRFHWELSLGNVLSMISTISGALGLAWMLYSGYNDFKQSTSDRLTRVEAVSESNTRQISVLLQFLLPGDRAEVNGR